MTLLHYFFWFELLEPRAEILEKISLVFWEILRRQKDIWKLGDHERFFVSIVCVYNPLWKRLYMSTSNTTTRDHVFCVIWKRFLFLFAGTGWTVNLTFSRNLTYVRYDFIFQLPALIIILSLKFLTAHNWNCLDNIALEF